MYTFLNSNSIIYNLQLGFRKQCSTFHAFIDITENTRKALDDCNIDFGAFVDLRRAFDTVDHQILLAKLNHYGIHRVSNDWFIFCLSKLYQYVSISGYDSGLAAINCGVPQGSALRPLLLLWYVNDFSQAIKCCKFYDSADDTNLLCMSDSFKKLNNLINADLIYLVSCLSANDISLNVKQLKS